MMLTCFRLNVGTGLNIFRTRKRLALHIWHNISVTRDSDGVNLIVDDEIIQMSSKASSLAVQLRGNLTFGSITHPIDRYEVFFRYTLKLLMNFG